MPFSDDDKDWLRLTMKDAVSEGLKAHRTEDHKPLEDRVDEVRRFQWTLSGVSVALSTFLHKLLP